MKRPYSVKIQILAMMAVCAVMTISCKKNDKNLPAVTTAEISAKTANSATGGGDVTDDGGSSVTEKGVCWSVYQNPTTADNKTVDGTGTGAFVSTMNGLSPDRIYYVKAYAVNSTGTAYGSEIDFTTDSASSGKSNFTDMRDAHEYRTIKIGNQVWMAENLAYLPAVSGPAAGSETIPYYYVYGSDSSMMSIAKDSLNYHIYGVLYNWVAAVSACPAGWRLPSEQEWNDLLKSAGDPAGSKLKETGTVHWLSPNTSAKDAYGFSVLPGGERYSLGEFRYVRRYGVFWSSASRNETTAWSWHFYYDKDTVNRDYFNKANGFSVRCLKN